MKSDNDSEQPDCKVSRKTAATQDTDAGTGSRAADNGHRGPKTHMPRCASPIMLRSHQNTSAVTTPAGALVSPEEQYGRHKRGGGRRAGGGVADRERRGRLFSGKHDFGAPQHTAPPRFITESAGAGKQRRRLI